MELDASGWSGDGTFTELLIAALRGIDAIEHLRVEDAPASRADAGFNFISNEVFVTFRRGGVLSGRQPHMTLKQLELHLTSLDTVGEPDYSDEGMLQYLRTERIQHAYQKRPYKLVELVRVYEAAKGGNGPDRNSGGSVS